MTPQNIADGEWIEVPLANFKMECCDCGLVHTLNFKGTYSPKNGKHLYMQAVRDKKLTNKQRKIRNITYEKD